MSNPEIKRTSSRIVYRNKWMTVREDQIERADGSPGLYGVVEKTDFAVIAAIENGMVHMVQQYRYPVEARFWELPQGTAEDEVLDAMALAKAELREETGLTADSMQFVAHLYQNYGYSNQGCSVFLATGLTKGEAQLEIEEQDLITRAIPIGEVEAMIRSGEIKDATTVAVFGLLHLHGLLG